MATITAVDIGAAPDDGNGDPLRTAFSKLNTNDTNLNSDKIESVAEDTTPQLGGDLDTDGNSLVTTANADLLLAPNGTGAVSVSGVTDYENNVSADDDIPNKKFCDDTYLANVVEDTTPQLGGDLTMSGNALVTTANADVLLSPNGSGAVSVSEVTDYEDNVTADDDIPNKKFCDDTYSNKTRTINAQTGTTFTPALTDSGDVITMNNAAANVLTVPTNAAVAYAVGTQLDVSQIGAGVTTVTGDTGVTINGVSAGSGALSIRYGSVTLLKLATNTWLMTGNHAVVA